MTTARFICLSLVIHNGDVDTISTIKVELLLEEKEDMR